MSRGAVLGLTMALTAAGCSSEAENQSPSVDACTSAPLVGVDHVTVAVADLAEATQAMQDLGFRIKDGTAHENGIRNAHIKTPAGSLELLTVTEGAGTPDELSAEYFDFIAAGGGGAFLALGGASVDTVAARVSGLGLESSIERGPAWNTLTFPRESALRHVYFFEATASVSDADSILAHLNGARRVTGVAMDGGPDLIRVLESVGAAVCSVESGATRLALGDVTLLVRSDTSADRSRIRGIEFEVLTLGRPPTEVHGFTVGWAPPQ